MKKYPGQRQVGLLFTAGQKHAGIGSGPISIFGTLQNAVPSTAAVILKTRVNFSWLSPRLAMSELTQMD